MPGKRLPTLYQGGLNNSKVTHMTKFTKGFHLLSIKTKELVVGGPVNGLEPLQAIYESVGPAEMEDIDVNYHAFTTTMSYLNPFKCAAHLFAKFQSFSTEKRNQKENVIILPTSDYVEGNGSLKSYVQLYSKMSIGQEPDMGSFKKEYKMWDATYSHEDGFIAYGVSRGAALIFNALSMKDEKGEYRYQGAKLVVLEGCFYSVQDILEEKAQPFLDEFSKHVSAFFTHYDPAPVKKTVSNFLNNHVSLLFKKYDPNGISPAKNVEHFPKGIPVVLITSETDEVVPTSSTQKLANALADRGENDVYLIKLKNSKHPSYMFSNKDDHDKYESALHAIYQRYGFEHDAQLAEEGAQYLDESTLYLQKDVPLKRHA